MTRRKRRKQQIDPRLLNKESAAAYIGISVEMFERYVRVTTLKIGRRNLIDVRDLDEIIKRSKEAGRLTHPPDPDFDPVLAEFDRRRGLTK
jgi:hypothetical protein